MNTVKSIHGMQQRNAEQSARYYFYDLSSRRYAKEEFSMRLLFYPPPLSSWSLSSLSHPYVWRWHIVHSAADWRLAIGGRHSAVPHDTQFPIGGRDLPRVTRRLWSHRLFITLMEVPFIQSVIRLERRSGLLSGGSFWRSFKERQPRRPSLVP